MRTKTVSQRARTRYFAVIFFVAAACRGWSQSNPGLNDPLLDLFVKKGYVTQQEAEQVEAEARTMQTNNAAFANAMSHPPLWKITRGIKDMELYGDIRIRYENRATSDPADNGVDLQRERYAIRIGLRGDAFDNFYYGLRLETASNPRSPWVTMGTSTSGGVYQGPFGKSTATLSIGQVYLGWHPTDWFDVTAGKMSNPLYTTPMVWDSDINPEGFAEHFKYTVGQADFFATLGQFYYADFNPNNAGAGLGIGGTPGVGQNTDDIFMFAWQAGFIYHITPTIKAKIAATLYNYTGLERSSTETYDGGDYEPYFGDPYIGEGGYYYYAGPSGYGANIPPGYAGYNPGANLGTPGYGSVSYPFNQVGLDYLQVLEIPFEVDFKIDNLAARFFGDFAYNLQGYQRAEAAAAAYQAVLGPAVLSGQGTAHSFAAQTQDVKAYQLGFGIGSDDLVYGPTEGLVYGTDSHKHDWEFRTYWQHIEQYALDPNIIDSDFFEGRENMEGIYAAFAYAVSDNVIITARYGFAHRINDLIGTGGDNQDSPWINPVNHYYLIQADATLRF